MIPQPINPEWTDEDLCAFQKRWKIAGVLASKVHCMSLRVPFGLRIISGFRTREEQIDLEAAGRPAADPDVSTHTSCPATGADLDVSIAVTNVVKATFGAAAVACGLRWGGGSPVDPDTGIPSDWNHVDLGPRRAT